MCHAYFTVIEALRYLLFDRDYTYVLHMGMFSPDTIMQFARVRVCETSKRY